MVAADVKEGRPAFKRGVWYLELRMSCDKAKASVTWLRT